MARSDGGTAAMDGGCCSSPPHAAVLSAVRAFLRSPARADDAGNAAGTLLGMATMLAGVILATDRGKERANARRSLKRNYGRALFAWNRTSHRRRSGMAIELAAMAVFIAPPGAATSGREGRGLLDDACLARKFEPVQRLVNFVAGRGEKARPRAALGAGRFGRARVVAARPV